MRGALTLIALALPGAAMAQDHSDHSQHQQQVPAEPVDHSKMDHSQHQMPAIALPIPTSPPPAAAFSGPRHAADEFLDPETMQLARDDLAREMGGMGWHQFKADRLEHRMRGGSDGYLWDVSGFIGGDINRFRFTSEGEGEWSGDVEHAEVQALFSRAVTPFFDVHTGVRQDLAGPSRTHAVLGMTGMAPYFFELDANAYLSDEGELTASIEAELDQRINQRLILQPRGEMSLSAQDIPELGIGAGIDTLELGLRLRYEIAREFAPYVGVEQEWRLGDGADYARLDGHDRSVTNFVVGVRFWF